jgi:hypothetical protein
MLLSFTSGIASVIEVLMKSMSDAGRNHLRLRPAAVGQRAIVIVSAFGQRARTSLYPHRPGSIRGVGHL